MLYGPRLKTYELAFPVIWIVYSGYSCSLNYSLLDFVLLLAGHLYFIYFILSDAINLNLLACIERN